MESGTTDFDRQWDEAVSKAAKKSAAGSPANMENNSEHLPVEDAPSSTDEGEEEEGLLKDKKRKCPNLTNNKTKRCRPVQKRKHHESMVGFVDGSKKSYRVAEKKTD